MNPCLGPLSVRGPGAHSARPQGFARPSPSASSLRAAVTARPAGGVERQAAPHGPGGQRSSRAVARVAPPRKALERCLFQVWLPAPGGLGILGGRKATFSRCLHISALRRSLCSDLPFLVMMEWGPQGPRSHSLTSVKALFSNKVTFRDARARTSFLGDAAQPTVPLSEKSPGDCSIPSPAPTPQPSDSDSFSMRIIPS